jgi:NosR/NirI family nitrous oxide reductase transcriptional regulator
MISYKKHIKSIIWLLNSILLLASGELYAQRFPKPEFESGHTQPPMQIVQPRSDVWEYFDVLVLIIALSVITWFVLKKRSRKGVFWTSIFSILYFGFFREGCICSVGSVQNVVLALFNSSYSIPVTALAFFVIPLIFTLFFGRTFCSGVCPLGAIQDIFLWKPIKLGHWPQKLLGLIPYIYLGFAVLYAATATDFVICRYDPFVGFYRLNAEFSMFILGGAFLVTSMFVGRPYCRFFCPYGVILNWMSRISKKHMTITPTICVQCKLCDNSCPFEAINEPNLIKTESKKKITNDYIKRVALIPVFVIVSMGLGYLLHPNFALLNKKVQLAYEVQNIEADTEITKFENYIETDEIEAFRSSGKSSAQLYFEAESIIKRFKIGSIFLGAFIGLIFGITIANLDTFKYRVDYEPNKGTCFSCARCMDYCPVDSSDKLIEKKNAV